MISSTPSGAAAGTGGKKHAAKSRSRRAMDSVGGMAGEVLKDDLGGARKVAIEAMKSQAYLYPFKGMVYFISHRSLWQPFLSRLGPYLTLSAGVVSAMFAFTYLPQLAVLVFFNGPFAVVSTVLLVLNESSSIINIISRGWMLQESLLDTFDGTLVACNEMAIVQEGREIRSGSDPVKRLGRVLKNPFERFGPKAMVRYLMYLPLNFIPIVGTIAFVGLQGEYTRLLVCHCFWADWDAIGRTRGRSVHERYFQLKKWPQSQRKSWVDNHVGAYTSFGLVATVLEMIPLANMFFTYTNTVGAALWAADIEAQGTSLARETAPNLRAAAERATGEKAEL